MNHVTITGAKLPALISMALLCAWTVQAQAQQASCINDSTEKVCAQLSAQPDTVVQASRLGDDRDTYVSYRLIVSNLSQTTSSRKFELRFSLSPAVEITEFNGSGFADCSVSGAELLCTQDKGLANGPMALTLTAKAPAFAGAATPATLVGTGVFGWHGKTATVSKSLAVSTAGGYTWVPPNTAATLVTAPETADPANQTSAENPVFAKMAIPPRPIGFLAFLGLNPNTGEDFSLSCSGGLYFSGNSDGGPYICRDIGAPTDSGNPNRWVETMIDPAVDGSFTAEPLQLTVILDSSVVPATQLAPTAAAPNGTPSFAVFYRAANANDPIRAYARTCDAGQRPCVSDVQKFATGDWTATLKLATLDNGGAAADPSLPQQLTSMLSKLLYGVVSPAISGGLPPPVIIR